MYPRARVHLPKSPPGWRDVDNRPPGRKRPYRGWGEAGRVSLRAAGGLSSLLRTKHRQRFCRINCNRIMRQDLDRYFRAT